MIGQLIAWILVSVLGGVTASLAGFGIGSLMTPALATRYSLADAVLAVSIPHAIATAVRCWRLRRSIEWRLLRSFGIASAIGGTVGALFFLRSEAALGTILGLLLIATGISGLTSWTRHVRLGTAGSAMLGAASGFFGGIAGNQGGLRAAALTTWRLSPAAFVATSTAVGLMVDAARLPVYIAGSHADWRLLALPIATGTAGVLLGTLLGERLLLRLSAERFRQIVSVLITALGIWLLAR